jgi:hypothetical protein
VLRSDTSKMPCFSMFCPAQLLNTRSKTPLNRYAYVYRGDHCYHIGTHYSQEQAVLAYEQAMRKENPELNTAPARVERPADEGCTKR